MEDVIFGLNYDISDYNVFKIVTYTLFVVLFFALISKIIHKQDTEYQYLILIRYREISKWWRKKCRELAFFVAMLVSICFFIYYLMQYGMYGKVNLSFIYAFLLWIMVLTCITYIFKLLSFYLNPQLSFNILILLEIISIFYGKLNNRCIVFYGNFLMLRRSNVMNLYGFLDLNVTR